MPLLLYRAVWSWLLPAVLFPVLAAAAGLSGSATPAFSGVLWVAAGWARATGVRPARAARLD